MEVPFGYCYEFFSSLLSHSLQQSLSYRLGDKKIIEIFCINRTLGYINNDVKYQLQEVKFTQYFLPRFDAISSKPSLLGSE